MLLCYFLDFRAVGMLNEDIRAFFDQVLRSFTISLRIVPGSRPVHVNSNIFRFSDPANGKCDRIDVADDLNCRFWGHKTDNTGCGHHSSIAPCQVKDLIHTSIVSGDVGGSLASLAHLETGIREVFGNLYDRRTESW